MRELRDNIAANGTGGAGGRIWAQTLGQVEERTNTRAITSLGVTSQVNLGYKQDYFGGQMGMDFGSGGFAFGVTGGYLNSNLNFANSADRINFDDVNGGVYANYSMGGFFINALGKYDYYWGSNNSQTGRYSRDMKGSIYGAKAEIGYRFGADVVEMRVGCWRRKCGGFLAPRVHSGLDTDSRDRIWWIAPGR